MPDFCAAYGCSNQRTTKTRAQGITFHRFPSDGKRRQAWTVALRRKGFVPKLRTVLCSCHFRPDDFDTTGQTVRLREGAIPSIFNFPKRLSKLPHPRSSRTSKKAGDQCPPSPSPSPSPTPASKADLSHPSDSDHPYALNPVKTKQKFTETQDQVEKLRQELRNARDRERRQRRTVRFLLENLKEKDILTEELQKKLDFYSDLPVELFKRNHAFTPEQREFASTLYLHGPKAYGYLRETMKIPLPHPHTLLKWSQTVGAKPGLSTSVLDMLQRRKNEDPDRFGQVCLVLDGVEITRQAPYDSDTCSMQGFVDVGMGIDETR